METKVAELRSGDGIRADTATLFVRDEDDPADPATHAEAERIAYERDSIRGSQQLPMRGAGGSMTLTPDVLHPDQRD